MNNSPVHILPQLTESNLPSRFEAMAALFQYRSALVSDTGQMDYGQLNAVANNLAHALLQMRLVREETVALLMCHDAPLIAAMLGILKAGLVVVTLNPTDPPARLQEILNDASAAAILTDQAHYALAGDIAAAGQLVLRYQDYKAIGAVNNPGLSIDPGATAFIIYTSGTTGRPKGVVQTHRNALHNAQRLSRGMAINEADRLLLPGALSGGQGIVTTWCALLNGASLCPFPVKEKGVVGLVDWMREKAVSIYVSSASLFRALMRTLDESDRLPGIRLVLLASEAVTRDDFQRFQRHFSGDCVLLHTLSSSETGNIAQLRLPASDLVVEEKLPVGFAAEGIEILLLDPDGQPAQRGEPGEIVVKSAYLSPGYWQNAALTAAKFQHAKAGDPAARTFHTGDRGRLDKLGRLVYLGRRDHQVKIRGYRIELAEIEQALTGLDAVDAAVVAVRPADDGENRIIAYVASGSESGLSAEFLRSALQQTLPVYMAPSFFVVIKALPLNAHGKIDRHALSLIDLPAGDAKRAADILPRHGLEATLERIWSEAFAQKPIARDDNFFELGGDSLTAMIIAAKVHTELGVEVPLNMFTEHGTFSSMAMALEGQCQFGSLTASADIMSVSRDFPLPLSFIEERVWWESQTVHGSAGYTMASCYRLTGSLDLKILRDSMDQLVRRHEILRTTFPAVNGQPLRTIHAPFPQQLSYLDFSALADPEQQAEAFFKRQSTIIVGLEAAPLLIFWLIRVSAEQYLLLRVNHHIIADAWFWASYFDELGRLYEAQKQGRPLPLPQPIQYADFAVWQRQRLSTSEPAFKANVDWWREKLANSPKKLVLPFRRDHPKEGAAMDGAVKWWQAAQTATARLKKLEAEHNASYFMVRLAVFVALLASVTRQNDLVIATYMSHRNQLGWQNINMLGFFADLSMLRFSYNGELSLRTWLGEVRSVLSEALEHTEIPYQTLCDKLRSEGAAPPEISALFILGTHFKPAYFAGIALTLNERRWDRMPWGFTLRLDLNHQEAPYQALFDAGIYDPEKVARFMRQYLGLLDLAGRYPDHPLSSLINNGRIL